jgi:hypothetical protein
LTFIGQPSDANSANLGDRLQRSNRVPKIMKLSHEGRVAIVSGSARGIRQPIAILAPADIQYEELIMARSETDRRQVALTEEYFRRLDAGRPDLADLMTDDVQIYFPKFGIGRGKGVLAEIGMGLGGTVEAMEHDYRTYTFICSGSFVVVEGTTRGRMKNGKSWAAGVTPGGRFCNVFQFRGDLISQVHVYLDPDYVSEDAPRFLWGRDGRTW